MIKTLLLFCLLVPSVVAFPIQQDSRFRFKSILHDAFGLKGSVACEACKGIVEVLHGIGSTGLGEDELASIATKICLKLKLKDVDTRVCDTVTQEFKDELWYVIIDAVVEPSKICGWVFGESCAHFVDYFPSWNITLPPRKRDFKDSWNNQKKNIKPKKILHLSDTHIDFDYKEGNKAVCNEPMCCRSVNGRAGPNDTAAPKWGYPGDCDANPLLINNLFGHIADAHKDVDFIYWTGDVPAHNVWNQSRENQIETIKQASDLLRHYFPNKTIYPALGNHEGKPVNSFPPPFIKGEQSLSWLLDTLVEDWTIWLPADTKETIGRGGFYTVLVEKGFRIVSLNMNYGHDGNWWLWINSTDPAGQLEWLVDVLTKAEENHEKVHILGHVPPGGTQKWFKWNYYRIVDRFADTIAAQFFGHTHHDEFNIMFNISNNKIANNIAYIGPSVTTYNFLNPGYRTYDVDGGNEGSTWNVINHDTYFADILKADDVHSPIWAHEYNAKTAYGMKDLSPAEWYRVIREMENDPELFQVLFKNFRKQFHYDNCDDLACRKNYVCTMMDGPFKPCDFTDEELLLFTKWRQETYTNC